MFYHSACSSFTFSSFWSVRISKDHAVCFTSGWVTVCVGGGNLKLFCQQLSAQLQQSVPMQQSETLWILVQCWCFVAACFIQQTSRGQYTCRRLRSFSILTFLFTCFGCKNMISAQRKLTDWCRWCRFRLSEHPPVGLMGFLFHTSVDWALAAYLESCVAPWNAFSLYLFSHRLETCSGFFWLRRSPMDSEQDNFKKAKSESCLTALWDNNRSQVLISFLFFFSLSAL